MTWFSEFTEFITLDGMIYPFINGERFMISEEGWGMPPIEYLTQRGPLQHGETVIDYRLGRRIIQIIERQDTCSRFDYWDERTNMINALRPNRHSPSGILTPSTSIPTFGPGVLRKKLPNGNIRDIKVFIEQGPGFVAREEGKWDEWGFTEALRFVAHDPIFYDPDPKTFSFTLDPSTQHLVFPFAFNVNGDLLFGEDIAVSGDSLVYPGNWFSFPNITVVGPISNFKIVSLTINEHIELTYSISAGEIVTFSLPYGNKTVTSNIGSDLLGAVTDESKLSTFRLECDPQAANGINMFQIFGSGADASTLITLDYYERYIGI